MPDTPLNPDALEAMSRVIAPALWEIIDLYPDDPRTPNYRKYAMDKAGQSMSAYLAVAQPEVTGEQVNLAGWTCNGIHEPGDYSTCEECRDACDDLARFYNHMMRSPRPFKHWTGSPEVTQ